MTTPRTSPAQRPPAARNALLGLVLLSLVAAGLAAVLRAAVRTEVWQALLLAAFVLVAGIGAGAAAHVRPPVPAPRGHRFQRPHTRAAARSASGAPPVPVLSAPPHPTPHGGPVPPIHTTTRAADTSHAAAQPAGEPGPALPVPILAGHPGTAGQVREEDGTQCATAYPDGSSVCVRPDTAETDPADLAAQLLPEGTAMSGYLRVDGRLLFAQERRTDGSTVRAVRWQSLLVAALTPAATPGIPQVRLTRPTHEHSTAPTGEAS
ncbi:hypothetical protein PUR61_02030 [Streptomyces sp. BE20]|uniref:hypothetical protein n=1 Tax=Streptomyces sp. BE20 TaxID=3002525 RepID=UPI002E790DD4|nr:hypothetical protein [Streptomyces sp. BE20]MEE1820985.1 hypothetical protein [Streptomyces sp. BE20]